MSEEGLDSPRRSKRVKTHPKTFFTIGHGTKTVDELAELLQEHNIKTLVDVRTVPRSRTNPQHNQENLQAVLPSQHGIAYRWLGKELGGLRKRNKELGDMNAGWYNASFRGYADYMQSKEFADGIKELLEVDDVPRQSPVCYMCAETYYRQCHRGLISDALVARGYEVKHIVSLGKPPAVHEMTDFAKIEHSKGGVKIIYPPYEGEEEEAEAYRDKKSRRKVKKEGLDVKQPKIEKFAVKKGAGKRKKEGG